MKKRWLVLTILLLGGVFILSGCYLLNLLTPSDLAAKATSTSSIQLNWKGTGSEFIVYRSVGTSANFKEINEVTTKSYLDTNLSANTTYFYEVKSKSKNGTSAPSNIASATTYPLAPILKIISYSTNSVALSWTKNSDVEGYKLYRSLNSMNYIQIATITAKMSYTDKNLKPNTKYYYKMKAYNKEGKDSAYSNVISITTRSNTYTISGYVKDSNGNGISGVTISFSGGYSSVTTDSNGHWSKDGLSGSVVVKASKKGYTFTPSSMTVTGANDKVDFTATVIPPNKPSNPSPSNGQTGVSITPTLSWSGSDPSGLSLTYDVYFGTSSNNLSRVKSGLTSTSYKTKKLEYSKTYYWKIVAKNSVGGTTSSDVWSFTTSARPIYTVSGYVRDSNGKGISGVTISFSGGYSSVTTDSNGHWSKDGLSGKVVVTPSKKGYTFNPFSRIVTGANNNLNFTATVIPPNKPSNPSPSNGQTKVSITPTLSWSGSDPSGLSLTYDVYFGTSSNLSLIKSGLTSTSYKTKTLEYSKTYYWKIVAKNSVGGTTSSEVWSFTTKAKPAPTTYTVSGYVKDNNGKGISGVTISFSGGYSSVTTDSNGHWTKDGLSGSVVVTPSKSEWIFTPSNITVTKANDEINFTGTLNLAAPTNLRVTGYTSNSISLSWINNSSYAEGFEVYRSTDGKTYSKVKTLAANTTTYTDTGLTPNTTYYYKVRAYKGSNHSNYSKVISQKTKNIPPAAPSNLSVTGYSTDTITLSWTDNSNNEDGFEVYRSTDGKTYSKVKTLVANTTTYTDTGLTPNTIYYYKITAYNNAGNSAYSNTAHSITTLPDKALLAIKSAFLTKQSSETIIVHAKDLTNVGVIRAVVDYNTSYIKVNSNVGNKGVTLIGPVKNYMLIVKTPSDGVLDISLSTTGNGKDIPDDDIIQISISTTAQTGMTKASFGNGTSVYDSAGNPITFTTYNGSLEVE